MSKHTPGPWALHDGDFFDHSGEERPGGGWTILMRPYDNGVEVGHLIRYAEDLYEDDPGFAEAQANAHVIKAAGNMLEALEYVMWDCRKSLAEATHDKNATAIAKATGEPS